MIASIGFRNFKALRNTRVALTPFNLVIGPNGSGKTSLIEATQRLRTLAKFPLAAEGGPTGSADGPTIEFQFDPPYDGLRATLGCVSDVVCDTLRITPADAPGWTALRGKLDTIRHYALDHGAIARPSPREGGAELAPDGGNLAAVLASLRQHSPENFSALAGELVRIMPEFQSLEVTERPDGRCEFALVLAEGGEVRAGDLSQGMLYLVGVLALAFDPQPPGLLCIEEVDRGIHPRTLREIRDALYRLSYPKSFGLGRAAVQVVATSHSPYFVDLFRDHPEEIVLTHKQGSVAHFSRLTDRPDLPGLMQEGSLGDMWFSGILGGVPDESAANGPTSSASPVE